MAMESLSAISGMRTPVTGKALYRLGVGLVKRERREIVPLVFFEGAW